MLTSTGVGTILVYVLAGWEWSAPRRSAATNLLRHDPSGPTVSTGKAARCYLGLAGAASPPSLAPRRGRPGGAALRHLSPVSVDGQRRLADLYRLRAAAPSRTACVPVDHPARRHRLHRRRFRVGAAFRLIFQPGPGFPALGRAVRSPSTCCSHSDSTSWSVRRAARPRLCGVFRHRRLRLRIASRRRTTGIHLPFWVLIFLGAADRVTVRRGPRCADAASARRLPRHRDPRFGEIIPDLATNNVFIPPGVRTDSGVSGPFGGFNLAQLRRESPRTLVLLSDRSWCWCARRDRAPPQHRAVTRRASVGRAARGRGRRGGTPASTPRAPSCSRSRSARRERTRRRLLRFAGHDRLA